ncbi:MAG: hypothetical protein K2H10_07765 [Bacteroidales bacterium]|nr:hypothetical protein [Bacteroidales bacterium]
MKKNEEKNYVPPRVDCIELCAENPICVGSGSFEDYDRDIWDYGYDD